MSHFLSGQPTNYLVKMVHSPPFVNLLNLNEPELTLICILTDVNFWLVQVKLVFQDNQLILLLFYY